MKPLEMKRLITLILIIRDNRVRYIYLGDKLTDPTLVGMECDPLRRADGKCIVSIKMATALVVDEAGRKHVVLRRRLRLNKVK